MCLKRIVPIEPDSFFTWFEQAQTVRGETAKVAKMQWSVQLANANGRSVWDKPGL